MEPTATLETVATATIPSENIASLMKLILKYNRKGGNFRLVTGETVARKASREVKVDRKWTTVTGLYNFTKISVVGEFNALEGWTFLAAIEHAEPHNIVNGIEGSAKLYRDSAPKCDHCNTNRRRKYTFIVTHDDGTTRQIGKTCLVAYFGKATAAALVAARGWLVSLQEFCEDEKLPLGSPVFTAKGYVAAAMYCVATKGFVKSGAYDEVSTWEEAIGVYNEYPEGLGKHDSKAAEAIAWALSQSGETNYMSNLQAALSHDTVDQRQLGLVASLASVYNNHLDKQASKAAVSAVEPADVIEGKITIEGTIISVKVKETDWGSSLKMIVLDERGFKVWGSVPRALETPETGDHVKLIATVRRSDTDPTFGFYSRPLLRKR